MNESLKAPMRALKGVGPERAAALKRLEIETVWDLLLNRPRRHEDRRKLMRIGELTEGAPGAVHGRVTAMGIKRYARGMKSVFELVVEDGTGRLHCRWWNQPFMQSYFNEGDELVVFGKVISTRPRTIDHPETEVIEGGESTFLHVGRLAPVYGLTEGVAQRFLRRLHWEVLNEYLPLVEDPFPRAVELGLPGRIDAIRQMHFPEKDGEAEAGRRRLAFDEFLALQIEIQARRQKLQVRAGKRPCPGTNLLIRQFLKQLGFALTAGQTKVLREIRADLTEGWAMRRLLQGDVGSGKTVVAACTALMVIESGFNVALMAPTEILAEQHYATFTKWFEPLGIEVVPVTGARGSGHAVGDGVEQSRIWIGTHALLEEEVSRLGLVIIDEQHKFGVAQREALVKKGLYPHLLVMTATPIPRTLALTLYADLDSSVLADAPAGRKPVRTFIRAEKDLEKVWSFVRQKLGEGNQAFIICARIEESGTKPLRGAKREWERIQEELAPHQVGLLHGRLKAAEKETMMQGYRANQIQALVATQMVEVGIDVPNASVMVIFDAEQFGLAQLHQLRGRIGRGANEGYCILISRLANEESRQRLRVLEQTSNGFEVAEADLKLRGAGDLTGWQQSGMPPLRFGDLAGDRDLVEMARREAKEQVRR